MNDSRPALPIDAEAFILLREQLHQETNFLLFEPEELSIDLAAQTRQIEQIQNSDNSHLLFAENEAGLSGFILAQGGWVRRNRHCASVVIAVIQELWGKGLGTQLMQDLEKWCASTKISRLELNVMRHNEGAIAFYEKCGFSREGIKRRSLRLGNSYVDELYMGKLL